MTLDVCPNKANTASTVPQRNYVSALPYILGKMLDLAVFVHRLAVFVGKQIHR
jgi:hypothetical protein